MAEKTVVIGRKTAVGIGLETTKGTAVEPAYFFPHLEGAFKDVSEIKTNESAYGNISKYNSVDVMSLAGEGSVKGKLFIKSLYYWLALVFGQKPATSNITDDTTAKKHSFTLLNENTHLSSTISIKNAIDAKQFSYAMLESAKFEWSPDDYPTVELNFVSKKSVDKQQSEIIVGYIDDAEFLPRHGYVKIADSLSGLASDTTTQVLRSFSIEFKKNLVKDMLKGDVADIFNMAFEVSGSLERTFTDKDYRNKALNGENMAMEIGFIDDKNKAGTETPTSLKFTMPKVAFNSYEQSDSLDEVSTESVDFTALFDATTGKTVDGEIISKYTY